jgi:hypothetical protein
LQLPPLHVPGLEKVRSVVDETHVAAGGALHVLGVPTHAPLAHVSPVVHALPSSHEAPLAYA